MLRRNPDVLRTFLSILSHVSTELGQSWLQAAVGAGPGPVGAPSLSHPPLPPHPHPRNPVPTPARPRTHVYLAPQQVHVFIIAEHSTY